MTFAQRERLEKQMYNLFRKGETEKARKIMRRLVDEDVKSCARRTAKEA